MKWSICGWRLRRAGRTGTATARSAPSGTASRSSTRIWRRWRRTTCARAARCTSRGRLEALRHGVGQRTAEVDCSALVEHDVELARAELGLFVGPSDRRLGHERERKGLVDMRCDRLARDDARLIDRGEQAPVRADY